jgi:hypothetical protein
VTPGFVQEDIIMKLNRGIIEFICEGGAGGEARVIVELRTKFPGIGGTIVTHEGVAAALREEYKITPKAGHKMFLRHAIIKKLDDYFHRTGVYFFAHVPRPLGSISRGGEDEYEAYIYEWAFGSDKFPWLFTFSDGRREPVRLHDWEIFASSFMTAGVNLANDITDPDDGRMAQNIVHQYPIPVGNRFEMSSLWKRIDFGFNSITIDFEGLSKFLHENKERLIQTLRYERYELILLARDYLAKGSHMSEVDIGRLDALTGDYRSSSLRHVVASSLGVAGESAPVYIGERSESL